MRPSVTARSKRGSPAKPEAIASTSSGIASIASTENTASSAAMPQ
jgi:hypothetical protein